MTAFCGLPKKEKEEEADFFSLFLCGRKHCLINTMPVQVILYFFLENLRQFCVSFFLIDCESYEFQHSVSSDVSQSF